MGRLLTFLIVLPIAVLIVVFAVANRGAVTVDAWPLPYAIDLPLAALVFVAAVVGILVGGCAAWVSGLVRRRHDRARFRETEAALRREIDGLRSRLAGAEARLPAPGPGGRSLPLPPADAA